MRILLIRHGKREFIQGSSQTSLSSEGRQQVEQLHGDLARLDLHPTLILTSQHAHARETAEILASAGKGESEVPVIGLKALTSAGRGETPPPPGNIEQIADEARDHHSDFQSINEVAIVAMNRTLGSWSHVLPGRAAGLYGIASRCA